MASNRGKTGRQDKISHMRENKKAAAAMEAYRHGASTSSAGHLMALQPAAVIAN